MIEEIFNKGAEFFNERKYREAHEEWEALWIPLAESPRKSFIQGLIMIAVGLYKFERKENSGTIKLFTRGLGLLKENRTGSAGMDAVRFLEQVERFWDKFRETPEEIVEEDIPKIKWK
jgi:predicted metal-dependent hydrolase